MISQYFMRNSQPSILLVKRDGAFDHAGRVENTNFTGAEACAALNVVGSKGLWRNDSLQAYYKQVQRLRGARN